MGRHRHCYRGQWKHSEQKELRHYSRHTFLLHAVLTKIKKRNRACTDKASFSKFYLILSAIQSLVALYKYV